MKEKLLLFAIITLVCTIVFSSIGIAIIVISICFLIQKFFSSEVGNKFLNFLKTFNGQFDNEKQQPFDDDNHSQQFDYEFIDDINNNLSKIQKAYETLKLSPNCSVKELKKAYRKNIKKYHPDAYEHKNLSNLQRNQYIKKYHEIESAYELLKQDRGIA